MEGSSARPIRSEFLFMAVSAALSGYFGFLVKYSTTDEQGNLLFFVALLVWTLRIGTILFGTAAILTLAGQRLGLWLYAMTGIAAGLGLLSVGILDWLDTHHQVYHPFLTILLGILCLYGGIGEMREILGRAVPAGSTG